MCSAARQQKPSFGQMVARIAKPAMAGMASASTRPGIVGASPSYPQRKGQA